MKNLKDISKMMSLVLRHQPEVLALTIDKNGWADVQELVDKMNKSGFDVTIEIIDEVVSTSDKKRFIFNEDKTMIRANQGHSLQVDLELLPSEPREFLYHGTGEKNVTSILAEGIQKRNRQHVHLSTDINTAQKVGARHGKPIILTVQSGEMHKQGILFYLSANNVWLTDFVDAKYISK